MLMRLYLKGGQTVSLRVEEFTINKNAFGEMTKLSWTTEAGIVETLKYIRLEDVSAVVRVNEPGDNE